MLDINKIRENKEEVKLALLKRVGKDELDLDGLIELDDKRRGLIAKVEELKAERNRCSKARPDPEAILKMRKMGEEIAIIDDEVGRIDDELRMKLSELPNIPADDVAAGGKENNKVIKIYGDKPSFEFDFKDHLELAESLGLIDYKRAVKMSGTGFWCYKGDGALLEWALLNYFIDFHRKNGYEFILPPYLLNEKSAYASGHLPKFRDDLYWVEDGMCLDATAEMMLNNYHRDEILAESGLPKKYFAYSACFRREAGSYGKDERGMIRGHQFNKIEMFQFTKPEMSWAGFDELVENAERLVEGLGLHYQSVQLAAGDASAAMAKTIDVEVWIPSMNEYKEVSSISNALDYQARRSNIRYRDALTGKNEFLQTLNASGLATSRLLPAILEQNQQEDGSVLVPKVLRGFVGKEKIEKL